MSRELTIERALVWAYRDQRVDRIEGTALGLEPGEAKAAGLDWYGHSADGCYAIERLQLLGCRVDESGPSTASAHPDAVLIHGEVLKLKRFQQRLIILHSRLGEPPVWWGPKARIVQLYSWRVVMETEEGGRYTPVLLVGGPQEEKLRRKVYLDWHAGLIELAVRLAKVELATLQVTMTVIPREPWLRGRPGRPTLLGEADRLALISQARAGTKPCDLARRFELEVRQVYKLLEYARLKGELTMNEKSA